MRKTIVRTITFTTIKSAKVGFEKGQPVVVSNEVITLNGIVAEDKALKEVRKTYGENSQITEITTTDNTYEISVEDFIKYATKIETPTNEETPSNEETTTSEKEIATSTVKEEIISKKGE